MILTDKLSNIADAIRSKTGKSEEMTLDEMPVEIKALPEQEEVTMPLNMADGDMVVTPSDGMVISKATIYKPDTLIPENIAEGVNIAGIIGTLESGGGSSNTSAIVKFGIINPGGKVCTITHNLGVIPDVFVVLPITASWEKGSGVMFQSKYSAAFIAANNFRTAGYSVFFMNATATTSSINHPTTQHIESTLANGLNSATSETVLMSDNNSYKPQAADYLWVAIGGLT